jgi:hypothetical protein
VRQRAPHGRLAHVKRISHTWLIDPTLRTLEVQSLTSQKLAPTQSHEGTGNVRAAPFDAIELELGALWI